MGQITVELATFPLTQQFERSGVLRVSLEQPFEHLDALPRPAGAEMNLGQRHVRILVLRGLVEETLEEFHGGVHLPLGDEDERQIVGRFAVVTSPRQRVAEVTLGAIHVTAAPVEQSKVVESLGEIRLQDDRPLVEPAGFIAAPSQQQRVTKIVQGIRVVRCRGERGAEALDRRREIALLCEECAQVIVGFGKIRLQRKRAFECRPRAGCLTTFREQSTETVNVDGVGFACAARSNASTAARSRP